MALMEELKRQIIQAMKDRDQNRKGILRFVLGECETAQSRQGSIEDSQVEKIIRKTIEQNEETLTYGENVALVEKNKILAEFLPKQMDQEEIEAFFLNHDNPIFEQIVAAGNDGMATGIAVKALREAGLSADGKLVKEAVKNIRTQAS